MKKIFLFLLVGFLLHSCTNEVEESISIEDLFEQGIFEQTVEGEYLYTLDSEDYRSKLEAYAQDDDGLHEFLSQLENHFFDLVQNTTENVTGPSQKKAAANCSFTWTLSNPCSTQMGTVDKSSLFSRSTVCNRAGVHFAGLRTSHGFDVARDDDTFVLNSNGTNIKIKVNGNCRSGYNNTASADASVLNTPNCFCNPGERCVNGNCIPM